jgi:hypothetical protein
VYPKITSGKNSANKKNMEMLTGGLTAASGGLTTATRKSMKNTGTGGKRKGRVSSMVACPTLFQFNKGQTNPDVIKQVYNTIDSERKYTINCTVTGHYMCFYCDLIFFNSLNTIHSLDK